MALDEVRFSGDGFSLLRLLIAKKMARTTSVTSTTTPTTMPAIAPLDSSFDDLADELSADGVADAVLDPVAGCVEDSVGCAAVVIDDIVCWFVSVDVCVYFVRNLLQRKVVVLAWHRSCYLVSY